jgi:hypothetical protein
VYIAHTLRAALLEGVSLFVTDDYDPQPDRLAYELSMHPQRRAILPRAENEELYRRLDARRDALMGSYPRALAFEKFRASIPLYGVKSAYWIRNYIFDGALPIMLGVFAAVSLFAHWDLTWLQGYLPSFRGK